jgi:predicted GNAT family acetyltransferase
MTTENALPVAVRDIPESKNYEAIVNGSVVGTLIYELEGRRVVLTHTIVEPAYREHGVATTLVRGALDDIRAKGLKITVFCSFVSENPAYAELVDADHPGHAFTR